MILRPCTSKLYRLHKEIVVRIDKVLRDLIPDCLETRRKDVQKLQGR